MNTLIMILKSELDNISISESNIFNIIMASLLLTVSYLMPVMPMSMALLVFTVLLYCFCSNKLILSPHLSQLKDIYIKESQGLLVIYVLFRLAANLFEIKVEFCLFFYLVALVLFTSSLSAIKKAPIQLRAPFKLAVTLSILSCTAIGVEYYYYLFYQSVH
ncbi:hypothetical protein HWQ46_16255 [Shewanella sp. D64]|uniref:hypothetical protein n=1 Tax=unclassified Shewanella TaxID=196818 RepID=UPI0022BA30A6|nr:MULTISPECIES: hypothetical protein [unclassified Shewanella]MEC4727101.1 hypothetical protein [Shewanella sp. D64]MEC4737840.1 hypothetical protein [Shewanella sp. E94]WBJ93904.1 hypothetical protein HWQ47_18500 [Shewanella sp. MTB7]